MVVSVEPASSPAIWTADNAGGSAAVDLQLIFSIADQFFYPPPFRDIRG
jgi:hypothetical protein